MPQTSQEAPGCSTSTDSCTSCVEVKAGAQSELTEKLESLLACCRLHKEKRLLTENSDRDRTVACVKATPPPQIEQMIGPLFYCDLEIEGLPVTSMVDCGSQMTFISRSLLHRVARKQKCDPLELKMPTARLYGKGGPNGVNQLPITAHVDLHLQMNGETITVSVFVQPDSIQECLIGTNASIPLGFNFTDGKGKPLRTDPEPDPNPSVAHVSLIKAMTIPSRKFWFLKAKVTGEHSLGIISCWNQKTPTYNR